MKTIFKYILMLAGGYLGAILVIGIDTLGLLEPFGLIVFFIGVPSIVMVLYTLIEVFIFPIFIKDE